VRSLKCADRTDVGKPLDALEFDPDDREVDLFGFPLRLKSLLNPVGLGGDAVQQDSLDIRSVQAPVFPRVTSGGAIASRVRGREDLIARPTGRREAGNGTYSGGAAAKSAVINNLYYGFVVRYRQSLWWMLLRS
jgi:hypothetical protein